MENPFTFSNIVTGSAFCNRAQEQKDLRDFISSSQNVVLYSNRRMGKTSLIHQVFSGLGKEYIKLYVDLYGTVSEEDFIHAIMKNMGQVESKAERLINTAKEFIASAGISITIDPVTGLPALSPVFSGKSKTMYLDNIMALMKKYSEKKKMVIVFDEFQEIENYSSGEFEKRLRSIIQGHSSISYIFAGSKQHIMSHMFNSRGKAFYKLAEIYPLPEIGEQHYITWVRKLFKKHNDISDDAIVKVVNLCERHPMYIQQYFYHLWDREPDSPGVIDAVLSLILSRNENQFMSLWDSLTLNQRKALKLIAANDGKELYSAVSLQSVGFSTPSQVTKAVDSLMKKEIITKNGNFKIQDIMLRHWILRL